MGRPRRKGSTEGKVGRDNPNTAEVVPAQDGVSAAHRKTSGTRPVFLRIPNARETIIGVNLPSECGARDEVTSAQEHYHSRRAQGDFLDESPTKASFSHRMPCSPTENFRTSSKVGFKSNCTAILPYRSFRFSTINDETWRNILLSGVNRKCFGPKTKGDHCWSPLSYCQSQSGVRRP